MGKKKNKKDKDKDKDRDNDKSEGAEPVGSDITSGGKEEKASKKKSKKDKESKSKDKRKEKDKDKDKEAHAHDGDEDAEVEETGAQTHGEEEEEFSEFEDGEEYEGEEGPFTVFPSRVMVKGPKIEKPKIWVRIKPLIPSCPIKGFNSLLQPPPPMEGLADTECYGVGEDKKTLRLTVRPEDRLFQKKAGQTVCFSFETEGVLVDPPQEEMYGTAVKDVVEAALEGISSVVCCVGPEGSGKSFSLFGSPDHYEHRGFLPRALEDIFNFVDSKKKGLYHVIVSMFELRKDKIKDLLTLSPTDLNRVGEFGPRGLCFEEALSFDHALCLIMRGLAGQSQIPRECWAKFHTVVYLDILANVDENAENKIGEPWRARITFAKIASIPSKEKQAQWINQEEAGKVKRRSQSFSICRGDTFSGRKDNCFSNDGIARRCCGGPPGPLTEMIAVRKDMSFLEQMFTKTADLRKIQDYYNELQSLGMYMLSRPPTEKASQCFRQSKLAYCLKDIVGGKAFVRLILHVRQEKPFLQNTLELMRLAERARAIPCQIPNKQTSFVDKTAQICAQESSDKVKNALRMTMQFLEDKVEGLGDCKDMVKDAILQGFKDMWGTVLEDGEEEEEMLGEDEGETHTQPGKMHSGGDVHKSKKIKKTKSERNMEKGSKEGKKKGKHSPRKSSSKQSVKGGKDAPKEKDATDVVEKKIISPAAAGAAPPDHEEEEHEDDEEGMVPEDDQFEPFPVPPEAGADPAAFLTYKRRCWKVFSRSELGASLVANFVEVQTNLKASISEHNKLLKEVVSSLSKLIHMELNLDKLEQDRLFHDEPDEDGNLIPSEKELTMLQRVENTNILQHEQYDLLKKQREDILNFILSLEEAKRIAEKGFINFCNENFGKSPDTQDLPLGTLQHSISAVAQDILGFPKASQLQKRLKRKLYYGDKAVRYEHISEIAKKEAQTMIKRSYDKRPPWTMFY